VRATANGPRSLIEGGEGVILPFRTAKTGWIGAVMSTRRLGSRGVLLVILVAMLVAASLFAAKPAPARTFTVNYKGDATDDVSGDGSCNAGLGLCSLRAAIEESNAFAGADAIAFDIPSAGVQTIMPGSELPIIVGSFIGTEPSGTSAPGNGFGGVALQDPRHTIGGTAPSARNLISGNGSGGVSLFGAGSTVTGNLVGTDKNGTGPLGNGGRGVGIGGRTTSSGVTLPMPPTSSLSTIPVASR
jgi:hypothetical protein